MKGFVCIAAAVLLTLSTYSVGEEASISRFLDFTVLWDRASGGPKCNPNGEFSDLGSTLKQMGATIKELITTQLYRDDVLEDVDLVIICLRYAPLGQVEQETLVRYVRNGGSLLVMSKYAETSAVTYSVLINFGIIVTDNIVPSNYINAFAYPATVGHRPVRLCKVENARRLKFSGTAKPLAGYTPPGSAKKIANPIMALGGRTAKGRVIVIGNTNIWLSKDIVPCGNAQWGKEDNTELFLNTVEYLLGASDLELLKLKAKSRVRCAKNVTFKARVENLEPCFSRPCEIAFYLSRDKKPNSKKDVELSRVQIPEIRGDCSKLVKSTFKIPEGTLSGLYYLLAVINPDGEPLEINAGNNIMSRKITVN